MVNLTANLPGTNRRVRQNTAPDVNERIDRQTVEHLIAYQGSGPVEIEERLEELDHEWDVERSLEANATLLGLTGLVLGATVDRRLLLIPAVTAAFLFQHAIQGWCPPIPLLRRIGVRTATEITEEKMALRIMRGDFGPTMSPVEAWLRMRQEPGQNEGATDHR